jgi:hypothetical protein
MVLKKQIKSFVNNVSTKIIKKQKNTAAGAGSDLEKLSTRGRRPSRYCSMAGKRPIAGRPSSRR